jgi:nucleotide-binding universal stress UspA family protein
MYKKILVPVDFAHASLWGLDLARHLLPEGGELRLLYVLDESALSPMRGVFKVGEVETRGQEELEKLEQALQGSGIQASTAIRNGHVTHEVLEESRAWGAEALAIGSHGRKGLSRLLLGSVAERLLREIELPTFVVKHEPEDKPGNIAFATDFSEASAGGLVAFQVALKSMDAEGVILHVIDEDAWLLQASMVATSIPLDLEPIERKALASLEERVDLVKAAGLSCKGELLNGSPWDKIEEYVQTYRVGLVVLGTHGYRGYERFVLGSVAQKVLRTVSCPVLIVPHRH